MTFIIKRKAGVVYMFASSILEIFIIIVYIAIQIIGWIFLIINLINSLVECKNCDCRKNCEFLIFSEHCPKRYCMDENEKKELRKMIKELD